MLAAAVERARILDGCGRRAICVREVFKVEKPLARCRVSVSTVGTSIPNPNFSPAPGLAKLAILMAIKFYIEITIYGTSGREPPDAPAVPDTPDTASRM